MTTPASPAKVAPIKHPPVQAHAHRRTCDELGVCNCATSYCQQYLDNTPPMTRTERWLMAVVITVSGAAVAGFAAYLWTQLPFIF